MIELWFPTPVYFEDASSDEYDAIHSEYQQEEEKIRRLLEPNSWGDNITTTFLHRGLIKDFYLPLLSEFLLKHTNQFVSEMIEGRQVTIYESWVNYQGKHQYQERHTHPGSFVSGVFYMRTNGEDGALRFHPPSDSLTLVPSAKLLFENNSIQYQPVAGRIILFPGWAPHSVRANMTDHERLSISFNCSLV
jgi:uncharacterized protein (TIGR02466 family)